MAVRKFAVSFEDDLVRSVRDCARARGLPLSRWLAEAAQHQIKRQASEEALADYEAEFGAITEEERQEVRDLWQESR